MTSVAQILNGEVCPSVIKTERYKKLIAAGVVETDDGSIITALKRGE